MTIKEISRRITFFNDIKTEQDRIKSVEFFTILSDCIAAGYNYGKTGKRRAVKGFIKSINKLFYGNDKIDSKDIINPGETQRIIKRDKV